MRGSTAYIKVRAVLSRGDVIISVGKSQLNEQAIINWNKKFPAQHHHVDSSATVDKSIFPTVVILGGPLLYIWSPTHAKYNFFFVVVASRGILAGP